VDGESLLTREFEANRPHFDFTLVNGRVTRIDMIGDADVLSEIQIEYVRRTNRSEASDSAL